MKTSLRNAAVVLALVGGVSVAAAQTTTTTTTTSFDLSPAQRTTIYKSVTKERVTSPSTDVRVSVGAEIPRSVELHALPSTVVTEVPGAKTYKYTVVDDQVVIVDPGTMKVVEIIRE
jgi:hypothetical protein